MMRDTGPTLQAFPQQARRGRLPTSCPSCSGALTVTRLACPACETTVHGDYLLPAVLRLGSEDQQFMLAFLLRSGSLKGMSRLYGVSYPTVRNRLDDLIARLAGGKPWPSGLASSS